MFTGATLADAGIDGTAIKPTEMAVERALEFDVETVAIDYEGPEYVPAPDVLADLAAEREVRPTTPVRADGFDPLGDDGVAIEGVERLALAVGNTQFELLSPTAERDVRAMGQAGFEGEIAIYAPTVLTDAEDEVLDALGAYAARRGPVREALPGEAATDATASGRARDVLSQAVRDYGLVGDPEQVDTQVRNLREAGADHVVGSPACGADALPG